MVPHFPRANSNPYHYSISNKAMEIPLADMNNDVKTMLQCVFEKTSTTEDHSLLEWGLDELPVLPIAFQVKGYVDERMTELKEMLLSDHKLWPDNIDSTNPCPVCSSGITVDSSTPLSGGKSCGALIIDAQSVHESSKQCDHMKGVERICCPSESGSIAVRRN